MAFQFDKPQDPQSQGIASLPAPSSAQGNFAFQPQAAVQHPDNLQPRAQPLSNQQLGVTPQQQTGTANDAFAQSMQAWQAARQAELAGLKSTASVAPALINAGAFMHNNQQNNGSIGMSNSAFGVQNRQVPVAKPVAPTIPTFNPAPMPTDPQQYMQYVQQQQAAFDKQKLDYQNALNAYKG
jgi:hypothetical protein